MVGADHLISPQPLTNNRKTCLKELSTAKTSAKHAINTMIQPVKNLIKTFVLTQHHYKMTTRVIFK